MEMRKTWLNLMWIANWFCDQPCVSDWEKLTQEFPTHIPVENRRTGLFGALMGLCASFEYHQCGDSIIDYHKSKNIPLNVAIGAKYVKLCGRSNAPNAEEKIFHAYDELKKLSRLGIFDAATCENIIEALYKTSRWKECYKLLEMIDFTGEPQKSTTWPKYSFILGISALDLDWPRERGLRP